MADFENRVVVPRRFTSKGVAFQAIRVLIVYRITKAGAKFPPALKNAIETLKIGNQRTTNSYR
jgi:hypothetical protein